MGRDEAANNEKATGITGVGLADVLAALRHELSEAMVFSREDRIRFAAESVEVELSVVVSREFSGKAGARFWVVNAGADYSGSREAVQKVNLRLTPHVVQETDAFGNPVGVTGTAYVSGASTSSEEVPGRREPHR